MSDIRFLLKHPEGRRFYWGLLADTGVFRVDLNMDTNNTFFEKGRRSVGTSYLSDLLEAKPDALFKMQQEHLSEQKSEESIDQVEEDIKRKGELV